MIQLQSFGNGPLEILKSHPVSKMNFPIVEKMAVTAVMRHIQPFPTTRCRIDFILGIELFSSVFHGTNYRFDLSLNFGSGGYMLAELQQIFSNSALARKRAQAMVCH